VQIFHDTHVHRTHSNASHITPHIKYSNAAHDTFSLHIQVNKPAVHHFFNNHVSVQSRLREGGRGEKTQQFNFFWVQASFNGRVTAKYLRLRRGHTCECMLILFERSKYHIEALQSRQKYKNRISCGPQVLYVNETTTSYLSTDRPSCGPLGSKNALGKSCEPKPKSVK